MLERLLPEDFDKVIKTLKLKENEAIAKMVLHLSELDKRQCYRELGYSSIFSYCNVELDKETFDLLSKVKEFTGHIPLNELLKRTFRHFIGEKTKDSKRRRVFARSRYIPLAVRKEVRRRDQGMCTYVSKCGRRCSERCGLEYDHIVPYSFGGSNEVRNLRLRCRAHNQLHGEETFGREFMEGKRSRERLVK